MKMKIPAGSDAEGGWNAWLQAGHQARIILTRDECANPDLAEGYAYQAFRAGYELARGMSTQGDGTWDPEAVY